jgi:hypothetical protein
MAAGKPDSAAAWSAFLGGITPRLFLEVSFSAPPRKSTEGNGQTDTPHARPPITPNAQDIYRAGECYLCDVADVLEKEVLRLCEEQQKRSQGALRGGAARGAGSSSSSSSSGGGGGGPTDSSLHAEVAAGADFVWQTMLQAYELVGDQFELYATRNVFLWPEGVEFSVRAAARPRPRRRHLQPALRRPRTCP